MIIVSCKLKQQIRRFFIELQYIFRMFLAALILLVVASTIYDLRKNKNSESQSKILNAFAINQNWNTLIKSSNPKSIDCINGLKILTTFWIVVGHRTGYIEAKMVEQIDYNLLEDGISRVISFYLVAVDTFMVISGYLLTLSCLEAIKK